MNFSLLSCSPQLSPKNIADASHFPIIWAWPSGQRWRHQAIGVRCRESLAGAPVVWFGFHPKRWFWSSKLTVGFHGIWWDPVGYVVVLFMFSRRFWDIFQVTSPLRFTAGAGTSHETSKALGRYDDQQRFRQDGPAIASFYMFLWPTKNDELHAVALDLQNISDVSDPKFCRRSGPSG